MTLHESGHLPKEQCNIDTFVNSALPSIESTADCITYVASRYNTYVDSIDLKALSPFVPHALYRATVVQSRLWEATQNPCYLEATNTLGKMLVFFSKRWMNAGETILSPVRMSPGQQS